ncbi:hypothetical protein FHR23_000180 [Stakelama sediminis]|uniref:Uncharacterized protein n=1 Tax=Stakelama sediminis TaxID=463200 RepID=A0A840YUG3_9SPHN|nr:hypothetical protein [Stakelama sediminis]MBB5717273.1 hypothetical protein [Stakelama sediminis]
MKTAIGWTTTLLLCWAAMTAIAFTAYQLGEFHRFALTTRGMETDHIARTLLLGIVGGTACAVAFLRNMKMRLSLD